jgi:hypothetical protein
MPLTGEQVHKQIIQALVQEQIEHALRTANKNGLEVWINDERTTPGAEIIVDTPDE